MIRLIFLTRWDDKITRDVLVVEDTFCVSVVLVYTFRSLSKYLFEEESTNIKDSTVRFKESRLSSSYFC